MLFFPAAQVALTLTLLGVATASLSFLADVAGPLRPRVYRAPLAWLLAGAASGTLPGVYAVSVLPQSTAQVLLGVVSLAAVVLLRLTRSVRRRLPDSVAAAAGAASQLSAAVTGVGGPPLMVHLLFSGWDVRRGRMTYGVFFILANLMVSVSLLVSGAASPLWPVLFAGVLGTVVALPARVCASNARIHTMMVAMTALSGVVVLARGLFG